MLTTSIYVHSRPCALLTLVSSCEVNQPYQVLHAYLQVGELLTQLQQGSNPLITQLDKAKRAYKRWVLAVLLGHGLQRNKSSSSLLQLCCKLKAWNTGVHRKEWYGQCCAVVCIFRQHQETCLSQYSFSTGAFETGNHMSWDEARGCPDQGGRSENDDSSPVSWKGSYKGRGKIKSRHYLRSSWDTVQTCCGIVRSQLYTSRISQFSAANSSSGWNSSSHR